MPGLDQMQPTVEPGLDATAQHNAGNEAEHDREGAMAKADLYKLANYSHKLFKQLDDNDKLEAWVQAKITKAADYVASVYHYLEYEMKFSEYGKHLDNVETLSEEQKMKMKELLSEAKSKVKEIKKAQAEKQKGKMDEGIMSGGERACTECGGTGVVYEEPVQPSDRAKRLAQKHNVATRAYAAAAKRIDANKNGIPDNEEERDEETSSTGGTITRGKGFTRHTHNPDRFSDEPHAEPPSKAKSKSAAEKSGDKAADKQTEKDSKDWQARFGKDSVTKVKDGKKEKTVDEMYGQGVYEGKKKGDGNLANNAKPYDKVTRGDVIAGRLGKDEKGGKAKKVDEAKPSAGLSKAKKSAVVKKAKAGGDIGKPGKSFDKVAKAAGGGEKGKKIAAAAMWKNIKETTAVLAEKKKEEKDLPGNQEKIDVAEPKGKIDGKDMAALRAKKETVKESTDFTQFKANLTRLIG
jgi:hypothetical protein